MNSQNNPDLPFARRWGRAIGKVAGFVITLTIVSYLFVGRVIVSNPGKAILLGLLLYETVEAIKATRQLRELSLERKRLGSNKPN